MSKGHSKGTNKDRKRAGMKKAQAQRKRLAREAEDDRRGQERLERRKRP